MVLSRLSCNVTTNVILGVTVQVTAAMQIRYIPVINGKLIFLKYRGGYSMCRMYTCQTVPVFYFQKVSHYNLGDLTAIAVTDLSFPHFAIHATSHRHNTHTSDIASVLPIHWLPFAFCHQDCMRRHLNPLPVTKATDHHCNQIPATFHCFL